MAHQPISIIPVGAAIVGMIVGGVDFIMLLSDWFLARQEKRIQAAKEEGRKEGYAEGYAAAKAENGEAAEESPDSPSKPSDSPPKSSKKF